jgi:hypothetical protein
MKLKSLIFALQALIILNCCSSSNGQTVPLKIEFKNSQLKSVTFTRLNLAADSLQDFFNYELSFIKNDSVILVNYKSQGPIFNKSNQSILLVTEKLCMFEVGKTYSFSLKRKCIEETSNSFYRIYLKSTTDDGCSSINNYKVINNPREIASYHSNFVDVQSFVYEIIELNTCDSKYSNYR